LHLTPGEIYGFEGTVYDLHVYVHYYGGEEILVGEFEFGEPLVPCQEYTFEVNVDDLPPLEPYEDYIKLVLTDKDGNPIGWSSSQPAPH
jgi:hypothetical protein